MEKSNEHFELYKNRKQCQIKQSERRANLLREQQRQRNEIADSNRGFLCEIRKSNIDPTKTFNKNFQNKLQLSDWLLERPYDLDKWYLVPCPKGIRCLIVSRGGYTIAYDKKGYSIRRFRSNLPGDRTVTNAITILDAIFIPQRNEFCILDVLTYGFQEMLKCDTEFRFYWCKSKVDELQLNLKTTTNHIIMHSIDIYDFSVEDEIHYCLKQTFMFHDESIDLDGFLFYHKEASYYQGVTPLVGWLYSYMFDEVLQLQFFNDIYNKKPENYINYKIYIENFNKKILSKKLKKKSKDISNEMEILECENNLELNGMDISPQDAAEEDN